MSQISIFIVEDELLISASLKSQLQNFGYEILGSSTRGWQCIEDITRLSAQGKEPEIILMDIHLRGEIDGIETARILVEKFNCAIIFLTGQSSKEIYERSFKIKPFGYLLKPIDMEQTKMTIEIAAYQRNLEIENLLYQQQLEMLLEERKRENDEISALYQTMVNNSLVGMTITQDNKIVFANSQIAEMTGFDLEDLIDMSIDRLFEYIHPDDKQEIILRFTSKIQGKDGPNSSRFRIMRTDGSICHVESYAKVVNYKDAPALHNVYFDITSYWEVINEKSV
ncbi:MAG: response regulator [Bacteroidetes bacterium]|nr:response regulator [Bacteroidota bacterium]